MPFRLGEALDKYGVTYQQLARYTGRAKQTVYTDAYITGVTNKFKAMGYAYALQCDINQILERKDPIKSEGWEQPCLPNLE